MNRKLTAALSAAFDPPPPRCKQKFIRTLRIPPAGILDFVRGQIMYIRPRVWVADLCLLLFSLYTAVQGPKASGSFSVSAWTVSAVLPMLTLCLTAELIRSGAYAMSELELTCRHNLPRILLARMGILAGSNFILLLVLQAALYFHSGFNFFRFGVYFYSPLVLSAFGCLFAINRLEHTDLRVVSAAVCGTVSLSGLVFFEKGVPLLEEAYFPYWCGLLLALLAGIAGELIRFIKSTGEPTEVTL